MGQLGSVQPGAVLPLTPALELEDGAAVKADINNKSEIGRLLGLTTHRTLAFYWDFS